MLLLGSETGPERGSRAEAESPADRHGSCPSCGKTVTAGSSFCAACSQSLALGDALPSAASVPPAVTSALRTSTKSNQRGHRRWLWRTLSIILVVVVLAVIAVFVPQMRSHISLARSVYSDFHKSPSSPHNGSAQTTSGGNAVDLPSTWIWSRRSDRNLGSIAALFTWTQSGSSLNGTWSSAGGFCNGGGGEITGQVSGDTVTLTANGVPGVMTGQLSNGELIFSSGGIFGSEYSNNVMVAGTLAQWSTVASAANASEQC